jgi:hypothetical protein
MPRRKPQRPSTSRLSSAARDKMLAALSWTLEKQLASYVKTAPNYFDACRKWYESLSWEQRERVLKVVEAYTYWGEIAAERIAVGLPPAPRCPL